MAHATASTSGWTLSQAGPNPAYAALLSAVAGCSPPPSTAPPTTAPASSQAASTSPPVEGCPVVPTDPPGPTKSATTIDHVDFIRFDGREYLSGILTAAPINRTELGELITRSRCAFSELNNHTGKDPGPPRDGDTAFLASGTPIYAVGGWAPARRLAAERDGQVFVYVATDLAAGSAQPAPCALRHDHRTVGIDRARRFSGDRLTSRTTRPMTARSRAEPPREGHLDERLAHRTNMPARISPSVRSRATRFARHGTRT
jgi:hypothetical protein